MAPRVLIAWSLIQAAVVLTLLRLYGALEDTVFYFVPAFIATRASDDVSALGLITYLAIPLLGSLIGVAVSRTDDLTAIQFGTFLAGLLQAWPVLYFPDARYMLVPEPLSSQPGRLFVLYALFILVYVLIARLGGLLAIAYGKHRANQNSTFPLREVIASVVASAIWQLAVNFWQ